MIGASMDTDLPVAAAIEAQLNPEFMQCYPVQAALIQMLDVEEAAQILERYDAALAVLLTVYIWSRSFGLAAVIGLAMLASMVIASGAASRNTAGSPFARA